MIGDQHVAHPRRPAVGLDGSKNPIFWLRVHAFLLPSPKPFRQQRSHRNRGFRSHRFWLVDVSPDPTAANIDLGIFVIDVAPLESDSLRDPSRLDRAHEAVRLAGGALAVVEEAQSHPTSRQERVWQPSKCPPGRYYGCEQGW